MPTVIREAKYVIDLRLGMIEWQHFKLSFKHAQ